MLKLIFISLFIATNAAPGVDYAAPIPILKVAPAPILAPVAPVIKTLAPATSYATITKLHVAHPPLIETILAPQPIVKTIIPGYGYH